MGAGTKGRIARQRISDHRELLAAMEGLVEALLDRDSHINIRELRSFLRNEIAPQICAGKGQIHLDGAHLAARARAMMSADLDDIGHYVARIEDTISALEQLDDVDDEPVLQIRLRNLLSRLEAVLRLHVETEECLYLPPCRSP